MQRFPLILLSAVLLTGCSVSGPDYNYCAVAHVNDPPWVTLDRNRGYLVSKIGVRHSRKAERDIVHLAKQSLAENIYSDVHAYTESRYRSDSIGKAFSVTDQLINIATNVQIENVKTEFKQSGRCLVAWASVSPADAQMALQRSHPINRAEQRDWNRIKDSRKVSDYEKHIKKYPQGLFTQTAKARIDVLEKYYNTRAINRSGFSPPAKMFWHLVNNIFY